MPDRIGHDRGYIGLREAMLILNTLMEPPGDEERFPAGMPVRQMAPIESHARVV